MFTSRTIVAIIKKIYDKYPDLPFQETARAIYRRLRAKPDEFYRNFKPVNSTPPLRCNPASRTEIHTLTCHRHLFMYITAAKSLLRFFSDVAVVVHDDGSLTTNDIATIKRHIEGIKVIRRCDADKTVGDLFAPFPKTTTYRAKIINSLELTDHALLAGKEKLIISNSDILFLRRPDDVSRRRSKRRGCRHDNALNVGSPRLSAFQAVWLRPFFDRFLGFDCARKRSFWFPRRERGA
jgi:hypothetical protein